MRLREPFFLFVSSFFFSFFPFFFFSSFLRLREPQTKSRQCNLKIHENPHRHLLSSAEVKEGKRCLKKELRKWEINSTIQMTTSQTVLRHRHSVYFWAALIVLSILTRSRLDKPEKRKTLQLFAGGYMSGTFTAVQASLESAIRSRTPRRSTFSPQHWEVNI